MISKFIMLLFTIHTYCGEVRTLKKRDMRFIVAKAAAASLLLSSLQSGALASTCPENLDSSVEIDKASSSILHYSIVAPESGSPGVICARLESGIEGWYASSFLGIGTPRCRAV